MNISSSLGELAELLVPFLDPPQLAPEATLPDSAVKWDESEALRVLDYAVNDMVGATGPLGLKGLALQLTNGSGSITPAVLSGVSLFNGTLLNLTDVAVEMLSLSLGGVDSLQKASLLKPIDGATNAHSLNSALALDNLSLNVALNVTIAPMPGRLIDAAAYSLAFELGVGLRDISAAAVLLAGFDSSLDLAAALADPGCIALALLGGAVRQLSLRLSLNTLSMRSLNTPAPLDLALVAALNNVTGWLISALGPTLPTLLDGLAGSEASLSLLDNGIDTLLADLKSKATCVASPPPPPPPPPVPPGDAIDWRNSSLLRAFEYVADDLVGVAGLNVVARLLTNGSGSISLDSELPILPPTPLGPLGDVSLSLASAAITGLDTFTNATLLESVPADGAALQSNLLAGNVGLVASLMLYIPGWRRLPFRMDLNLKLGETLLGATLRLPVNESGLHHIQMQQFPQLGCWLAQVLGIELAAVDAAVGKLSLTLSSDDWGASLSPLAATLGELSLALPVSLSSIISSQLSPLLEQLLQSLHTATNCTHAPPNPPPVPMDFNDNSTALAEAFAAVEWLIDTVLGPDGINLLIDGLLPRGELRLQTDFSTNFTDAKLGHVLINVPSINLTGIDSLYKLSLLQPDASDAMMLHNTFGLGNASTGARPLRLEMGLGVSLEDSNGTPIMHHFQVGANLRAALLNLDAHVGIDLAQLRTTSLAEILDKPTCVLRPLTKLELVAKSSGLSFEEDLRGALQLQLESRVGQAHTTISRIPLGYSKTFRAIIGVADDFVDSLLSELHSDCAGEHVPPPSPPPPKPPPSPLVFLLSCGAGFLAIALLCFLFYRYSKARPELPGTKQSLLLHQAAGGRHDATRMASTTWNSGRPNGLDTSERVSERASRQISGFRPGDFRTICVSEASEADNATEDVPVAIGGPGPAEASKLGTSVQHLTTAQLRALLSMRGAALPSASDGWQGLMPAVAALGLDRLSLEDMRELNQQVTQSTCAAAAGTANTELPATDDTAATPVVGSSADAWGRSRLRELGARGGSGGRSVWTALFSVSKPPPNSSLAMHHSPAVRWLVTLFFLGLIVAFGWTHIYSIGATMSAFVHIAGEPVPVRDLFHFTLLGSISDEWKSGTYTLSALVGLFSGVWPFLKLAAQAALWWAPPTWISLRNQGRGLRFLDITGKYCITDTQMVELLMVAFHFNLSVKGDGGIDVANIDIEVAPEMGVFLFACLTAVSLISTHIHLHRHRVTWGPCEADPSYYKNHVPRDTWGVLRITQHSKAEKEPRSVEGWISSASADMDAVESFAGQVNSEWGVEPLRCAPAPSDSRITWSDKDAASPKPERRGDPELAAGSDYAPAEAQQPASLPPTVAPTVLETRLVAQRKPRLLLRRLKYDSIFFWKRRRLPILIQISVPLLLVTCIVGIGASVWVSSLRLHLRGLLGFLLGPEDSVSTWSIASIAAALTMRSRAAPQAWLRFIQLMYIFTSMVCPLLCPLAALIAWMVPMRARALRRVMAFMQFTGAWAWLDVFVVIMCTSLLSLNQFAQYTLGDECDGLNKFFASSPEIRDLLPGEPTCLVVDPELLGAFWWLMASAIAAIGLQSFVMQCADVALREAATREMMRLA